MSNIISFTMNSTASNLSVLFKDEHGEPGNTIDLSFEYLRVFAPLDEKGKPTGLTPKVYHKRLVQLLNIESVGKHGYRFIFDDQHSDIYTDAYLHILGAEYEKRWQHYRQSANTAINNREATIEIKEVK